MPINVLLATHPSSKGTHASLRLVAPLLVEGAHLLVMTLLSGDVEVAKIPGRFHIEEVLKGLRDAIRMRTGHEFVVEIRVGQSVPTVGFAEGCGRAQGLVVSQCNIGQLSVRHVRACFGG